MSSLINASCRHVDPAVYPCSGDLETEVLCILDVYTDSNGIKHSKLAKMPARQFLHGAFGTEIRHVRLVLVSHKKTTDSTSEKQVSSYGVSQRLLTEVLGYLDITSFFERTRENVTGVYTFTENLNANTDSDLLAILFDAFSGLWARYTRQGLWQGVLIMPDGLETTIHVADPILRFAEHRLFLFVLATQFTAEFFAKRPMMFATDVASTEQYTGHHYFVVRPRSATYAKLARISARATGDANRVSWHKIAIGHLIDSLLRIINGACENVDDVRLVNLILQQTHEIQQQRDNSAAYLTYMERRADRQIIATQHLVTQANATTNLEVAHNAQFLAAASRQDASSIKVLTAVATALLPGTFVATVFSMDMFDWSTDDNQKVISSRFWVYWAFMIPLTLCTFGSWLGWEMWGRRKDYRRRKDVTISGGEV